jgi:uncharacterized protein DUF4242
MPEYLVEWYVPRMRTREIRLEELRESAALMARDGVPVRYVRSIFIPEDELWLCFVHGPNAEAVRSVLERAHVRIDRIVEAMVVEDGVPE